MLRSATQRWKRPWRFWPVAQWGRMIILILAGLMFLTGIGYALEQGGSRQLVRLLTAQRFPLEIFLLEGAPGYSQPERARVDQTRSNGLALGMFLVTGVNISDARTFFLSYFAPPPQGPAWLGWAYQPGDPEFEGPILELLPEETPVVPDKPDSSLPGSIQNGEVLVGIYHTHNAECYAGDGGPEHLTGENGDVVKVGAALKDSLARNGIKAVHSTKIHDGQEFMKAYSESLQTGTQLLEEYASIRVLLDIHRDGLPPGVTKSTVTVKGQEVSTVMIVVGKKNPHWQENERFAQELIVLGEEMYPGLFEKNINYAADARYNQHLSNGGVLLEIGSQLNTLAEAEGAADAVADVLAEWFRRQ